MWRYHTCQAMVCRVSQFLGTKWKCFKTRGILKFLGTEFSFQDLSWDFPILKEILFLFLKEILKDDQENSYTDTFACLLSLRIQPLFLTPARQCACSVSNDFNKLRELAPYLKYRVSVIWRRLVGSQLCKTNIWKDSLKTASEGKT